MSKLAYVIGINEYNIWSKLKNPINDMLSLKECLEKFDFTVKNIKDPNKNDLVDFINGFKHELFDKDVGLLYFAGHGVEINGRQYLIPKDGEKVYNNRSVDDSIIETYVDITNTINDISKSEDFTGIIILDCCREQIHKFEERNETRGIVQENNSLFSSKQGVLISFSTGPNLNAKDGSTENGLFMKHLKGNIYEEDLKIEELFKRVRLGVVEESNYEQIPWEHSSLIGDFYFTESFSKKWGNIDNIESMIENLYQKSLSYSQLNIELNNIFKHKKSDCNYHGPIKYIYKDTNEFKKTVLSRLDALYLKEKGLLNG